MMWTVGSEKHKMHPDPGTDRWAAKWSGAWGTHRSTDGGRGAPEGLAEGDTVGE